MGAAGPARAARRDRRPLPVGTRRVRLGQQLLLGGRAGRHQELEGVLLRLVRRGATSITVDKPPASLWVDGAVGADLRRSARGASSCPRRSRASAAVGLLYAAVRRWFTPGGRPARRRGAGAHARRRADVPVQQPGRAARAAADRRRLRHGPGARGGVDPLAGAGRARWSASGSSRRCSRPCWWSRRSRSSTWSPHRPPLRRRFGQLVAAPASRWSCRPAGGSRSSSCARPRRARTSAARRTTASST